MEKKSNETLYDFIERRSRELTHQIAAFQGEIDTRRAELAHLQSAKRQIDVLGGGDAARFGKSTANELVGVEAKAGVGEIHGVSIGEGLDRVSFGEGLGSFGEGVDRATFGDKFLG